MKPETTQNNHTTYEPNLYMAMELGNQEWKLGFTIGLGQAPRLRSVRAGDLKGLLEEIRLGKVRFGLPHKAMVLSCYEAGRDGFWIHRYLDTQGVINLVVDSASIEVNRRRKRAKTDRMDVRKLLTMLVRYTQGEKKVWSVVHPPSAEAEDQRQLHRELMALRREQTHHINRIKGLLANQGVRVEIQSKFEQQLDGIRLWDGSSLPGGLRSCLVREHERYQLVKKQIREIELARQEILQTSNAPAIVLIRQLLQLKGIGLNSAWLYVMEFFSWRAFHNRRELGSLSGLTPTPYQSGDSAREQGISKAGNRPIRALAIEIAWSWLRNQPQSALSQWYRKRFASGSSRIRRIGIVALARKLLVALWKYLEYGEIPQGALLKTA
jgi:transposase